MLDEWYTPTEHVELARKVMGGIDLDPASCELAQATVRAGAFFSAADDGLARTWHGRVWLNPPYSRGLISRFSDKLIEEWQAGRIGQAVALVNAHPDGKWFQRLSAEFVLCLAHRRIKFYDGTRICNPRFPSAFFYAGPNAARFKRLFRRLGAITEPTPVRACRQCGEAFTPWHLSRQYCSDRCKLVMHRNAKVKRFEASEGIQALLHPACLNCDRPMPGARSHAQTCSTRCRVAAHRARAKETHV